MGTGSSPSQEPFVLAQKRQNPWQKRHLWSASADLRQTQFLQDWTEPGDWLHTLLACDRSMLHGRGVPHLLVPL